MNLWQSEFCNNAGPLPSRNPLLSDLIGKHRPELVPPEPHRFVTEIDTALMQQILDIAERQRKPDVQHHSEVFSPGIWWIGLALLRNSCVGGDFPFPQ